MERDAADVVELAGSNCCLRRSREKFSNFHCCRRGRHADVSSALCCRTRQLQARGLPYSGL